MHFLFDSICCKNVSYFQSHEEPISRERMDESTKSSEDRKDLPHHSLIYIICKQTSQKHLKKYQGLIFGRIYRIGSETKNVFIYCISTNNTNINQLKLKSKGTYIKVGDTYNYRNLPLNICVLSSDHSSLITKAQ